MVKKETVLISFLFIFILSFNLYAETIPQRATPGVEEETLREIPIEKKLAPKRKAIVERITPEELELPPEAFKEFFVQEIKVKGATVISPKNIQDVVNNFFDKRTSGEQLRDTAGAIADFFKKTKEAVLEGGPAPTEIEEEKIKIPVKETPIEDLENTTRIIKNYYAKKLGDIQYDENLDLSQIISESIISINRDLSLKDLIDIADAISDFYTEAGYVTSQAYVPPQQVEGETVSIKIVEGKVGKVLAKGQKNFKKEMIERGIKERQGEVLRYANLIKDITYLNRNPDREVRAVMYPSKTAEFSDIVLQVEDDRPFHITFGHDSLGTTYTGKQRNSLALTHNNLTKHDDIFQLKYTLSDSGGFKGFTGNYQIPLDNFGRKAGLDFSYARTTLGQEYEVLDVEGDAYVASLYYIDKLFDANNIEGQYLIAFDVKRATTDMLSTRLYYDALRVLKTGIVINEYDRFGTTNIRNELDSGFSSFLGASDKSNASSSRSGSGGQFIKYILGATRLNKLTPKTLLLVNVEGQFTPDNLVSMEQIRSGGAYTVRGYPESEALGDYGVNSNFEIRIPAYFWPKDIFPERYNPEECLEFLGFIDAGYVKLRKAAIGQDKSRDLASFGFGARLNLAEDMALRADIAWPIADEPEGESGFKVHFTANLSIDKTIEHQFEEFFKR